MALTLFRLLVFTKPLTRSPVLQCGLGAPSTMAIVLQLILSATIHEQRTEKQQSNETDCRCLLFRRVPRIHKHLGSGNKQRPRGFSTTRNGKAASVMNTRAKPRACRTRARNLGPENDDGVRQVPVTRSDGVRTRLLYSISNRRCNDPRYGTANACTPCCAHPCTPTPSIRKGRCSNHHEPPVVDFGQRGQVGR